MKTATSPRSCINDISIEQLQKRLNAWRKSNKPGSRITDALWDAAVVAAARYGISRTAKTLRLDYYNLRKRFAASSKDQAPAFMELLPAMAGGGSKYAIELEARDGSKMRILVAVESISAIADEQPSGALRTTVRDSG